MEGDGGSKNNKKGVRRPMNAFLIFCKRQRSKVREKNPQMDNRSITRVLGDIWAKMDKEEKASFTHLAKQYKDAFMKANPGYKWHSSDRVHNSGGSSGKASSKHGSGAANAMATTTTGKLSNATLGSKHHHYQDIHVSKEITPGKLADPGQMGGLNLLLKAGKESEMMQSKSKSKPTISTSTSSFSSLFSFTPISIPPLTKPHPSRMSSSGTLLSPSSSLLASAPSSLSLSRPTMSSMMTNPNPKRCPVSSSSSLFDASGVKTTTANSALLQLAEMCTTELYSGTEEQSAPSLVSQSQTTVAPPKKRAKQWHSESLSPLTDDNGRKHHRSKPDNTAVVGKVVGHDLPLDLSQANAKPVKKPSRRRQNTGMKGDIDKNSGHTWTWSRKRKRSSSATDSVSSSASPSISPIGTESSGNSHIAGNKMKGTADTMKSGSLPRESRDWEGLHAERELRNSSTSVSNLCPPDDSSKIASLLKAVLPPPSQQVSASSLSSSSKLVESKYTKVQEATSNSVPSSVTVINTTSSVILGQSHSQQQPFTQGKVKKKWTQRMMVEAQQEEELAKKESQQYLNSVPMSAFQSPPASDSQHRQMTVPQSSNYCDEKMEDSKPLGHRWGMIGTCKNPLLPPPPPINTSFPLPVTGSGEAHRSHTLYKALTSEISPPRHRSAAVVPDLLKASASSSKLHCSNIFDPITACGKKFTDHIVEQLVLHGSSNDRQGSVMLSHTPSSVNLIPPPPSSVVLTKDLDETRCSMHEIHDKKLAKCEEGSISAKPGLGIWASVPTHFPVDSDNKPVDWTAMKTEKSELDSSSFPASSLFEKVARKVSGPQRDVGPAHLNGSYSSMRGDSKKPDSVEDKDFPLSEPQPLCTDRMVGVNAALDICAAARRHQLNSLANGDMLQPCYPDRSLYEDAILQPVRKSRRANKGQKYQALIKEGIIQPSKERMAIRNASKVVPNLSCKEEIEHLVSDQIPELVRVSSRKERSTPSPKTVKNRASPIELFDFENSLVTSFPSLPTLQTLQLQPQPQPQPCTKKKRWYTRRNTKPAAPANVDCDTEVVRSGTKLNTGSLEDPVSNRYVQIHRHGILSYDPSDLSFSASLEVKSQMRGWCHARVPLTEEQLTRLYGTGRVRRKMRSIRTMHITHETDGPNGDNALPLSEDKNVCSKNPILGVQPTVSCPDLTAPGDKHTPIAPSPLKETVIRSDNAVSTFLHPKHPQTLSDQQSVASVTPPSSKIHSSPSCAGMRSPLRHNVTGLDSSHLQEAGYSTMNESSTPNKQGCADMMLSPLHLLTSAALQSERAVCPTASPSSHVSAPLTMAESVPSSPPTNSVGQISPRPASTPFLEDIDQASRSKYHQSFSQGGTSTVLSVPGLFSSQFPSNCLPSSCSSTMQQLATVESPSKRVASSALLSLSLTASAFNMSASVTCCRSQQASTVQRPSVISSVPHIASSLPTPPQSTTSIYPLSSSTGTHQKGLHTATAPTLLNVPVISSPITYSHQSSIRDVPPHKTFHPHQQSLQHRLPPMHHSQKLVKLLTTNQDETVLFGDTNCANVGPKRNPFGINSQQDQSLDSKRGVASKANRVKAKEKNPVHQLHNKSHAAFVSSICTADGAELKHPHSKSRRRSATSGNVVKKKQQRSSNPHQQRPVSQNPLNVTRGMCGSKLFPPSSTHHSAHSCAAQSFSTNTTLTPHSNVKTGCVTTAAGKKHKPTIWDHLSSQCPVPLKSAKTNKQQQSNQAMTSSTVPVTAITLPQQQKTVIGSSTTTPPSQLIPFSMTPNAMGNINNRDKNSGDNNNNGSVSSSALPTSSFAAHGHENRHCHDVGSSNRGNVGSDTDSANEDDDNEKVLCIVEEDHAVGSSDTDSAVESEFESATSIDVAGDMNRNVLCTPGTTATASLVLNLDRAPLSSRGIDCLPSSSAHSSRPKSEDHFTSRQNITPHSIRPVLQHPGPVSRFPLSKSHTSGFGHNAHRNPAAIHQSGSPNVVVVPPTTAASPSAVPSAIVTLSSDATRKNCESFIPVSSITLPSDLPEGDQDILSAPPLSTASSGRDESPARNILLAPAVPTPSSSQVTVKTIAPTSPYPSPHVTDLSASCMPVSSPTSLPPSSSPTPISATTTAVAPTTYGNILLSTLQNPQLVLVPRNQPLTNSTSSMATASLSSPLLSQMYLPLSPSPSSSVTASTTATTTPTELHSKAPNPTSLSTDATPVKISATVLKN